MTNSPDQRENLPGRQWQTRTTGDLSDLALARVEAINITQWLARIANSYVHAGTAEQRTTLEFRPRDAAIVTGEFDRTIALEMRLPALELQFLENGKPVPHVFDPEEHSPAELEAWLLVELLHRGIDRERFSKKLPYTVVGLMSGDAENYSPQSCRPGLVRLAALLRDATAVLNAATADKNGDEVVIRCVPQNLNLVGPFDSGPGCGGFAFSLGDAKSPEPYFFLRGGKGSSTIKASTLMAENDPIAAALKLKHLALD